jgi:hypothetical protein
VKNECEVKYTPFLSLPCPWRLDGLRAGQPGLVSRQRQDVSLLHNVQTGSGAHPASYPASTGGSFSGGKLFLYNAIVNFSSSFISYIIPSNTGHFCQLIYKGRCRVKRLWSSGIWCNVILYTGTNVSENTLPPSFGQKRYFSEDGGCILLGYVVTYLPNNTASYPEDRNLPFLLFVIVNSPQPFPSKCFQLYY